jgi:dTDP-glucose pyrophosphorylase/CBS domain-containing protein
MTEPMPKLPTVFLHSSIRETMSTIDRGTKGIALVLDEERRLLGTITDGDVRRALLASVDLNAPVSLLLKRKQNSPHPVPVTAPVGMEREALLVLMHDHDVRQLPLLDSDGRVVGLITMDELIPSDGLSLQAVIMAGGFGTRLRPLTEDTPKPMLPVDGRPIMQLIIEQLRQAGIKRVNITTHYQPEKITNYFGNGEAFGVELNYVSEGRPLGTAGALGLMEVSTEPLLVVNGDILTQVDFRAMLLYHQEYRADLTVGVRQYEMQVPYGVIECDDYRVQGVQEKPLLRFFVNAGIYLLSPSVYAYIPNGERFDMTDLIQRLLDEGRTVVSFPILEYWLDIGQHTDYEQAQVDMKDRRARD